MDECAYDLPCMLITNTHKENNTKKKIRFDGSRNERERDALAIASGSHKEKPLFLK